MKETAPIELTDEQVHGFATQGFLRLGRLTTEEELAWLRNIYDAILRQKIGYTPDELATLRIIDRSAVTALATVLSPERFEPTLASTVFFSRVRQAGSRLLDVAETMGFLVILLTCHRRVSVMRRRIMFARLSYCRACQADRRYG